jgi:hypothetical protein
MSDLRGEELEFLEREIRLRTALLQTLRERVSYEERVIAELKQRCAK